MRIQLIIAKIALLPLGFLASDAQAATSFISVYPSADTTLMENYPSNNFGGGTYVNSGSIQNTSTNLPPPYLYPRNRGLLKFDLASQLPPGSKIVNVNVVIEVTLISNDPHNTGAQFELHRVLRPWGEGNKVTYVNPPRFSTNGIGAPATVGEATWLDRFAFTTNTWAMPGGAPGIDYATNTTAIGYLYGPVFSPYYFYSVQNTNLLPEVQSWLENPQTNFGWMLTVNPETDEWTARRFGSRESTAPPRLDIDFIAAPKFENFEIVGSNIRFTMTAEAGYVYALEYRDSLSTGAWSTLTTISLPTVTAQVILSDTLQASGSRFYRLRVL